MTLKIEGIITEKKPYSGTSSNAPQGDIFVDNNKFACWDKEIFDKCIVGEVIHINYTEKENEYNGKKYVNKSISSIESKDSNVEIEVIKIDDSIVEDKDIADEQTNIPFSSGPFVINNQTYKINGIIALQ